MSEKIDEVRAALQSLVGKTIESASASYASDARDDRHYETIELVATDGTVVRLVTDDYESCSSWLEVSVADIPQEDTTT